MCVNTVGGFSCLCHPGFTAYGHNNSCCVGESTTTRNSIPFSRFVVVVVVVVVVEWHEKWGSSASDGPAITHAIPQYTHSVLNLLACRLRHRSIQ